MHFLFIDLIWPNLPEAGKWVNGIVHFNGCSTFHPASCNFAMMLNPFLIQFISISFIETL